MSVESPLRRPAPSAPEPFNADSTLEYVDGPLHRTIVRAVSVLAVLVYAAYLVYRAAYTINHAALVFSLLVYLAEAHGFLSLVFFLHETWAIHRRRPVPAPPGLAVDVFVTTYNEDVDLLRQTLRAAIAMRYPHETYVLDDGRRAEVRALADELGCRYITRSDNAHAKAGNWNNAFAQTRGEFIATFDADHVPRPDFLERTLGYFRDPKVALLQVPQAYHNLDSVQHRVSWKSRRMYGEQDAFFDLVMPGKDHWNAAFFCGTGAVLRRKALEPHGGILTGTITEDLHTSVVLHSEGWKSVYLNELLVTGLAPFDLKSLEVQRLRWAEGNLKVAGYVNPLTTPGLTIHQRISYTASLYHWTTGIPKLIFYAAPPWMLFTGTFPIANYNGRFLAIYVCFLATLLVTLQVASRGKGRPFMDELFNMVACFTLVRAVKRVVFGRGKPARFEVTAKKGSGSRDLGAVLPHAILLGFSALAIGWSLLGLGFGVSDDLFGVSTAMFWTLYNAALVYLVLKIGLRPGEKRNGCRFRANFPVEARADGEDGVIGVTADVAEGGCSLLWPVPLQRGARMPLRVHFGSHTVDWIGLVKSDQGVQDDGWHRYGVEFLNLTKADIDLVNDSVLGIVVPDLIASLSRPSRLVLLYRHLRRWFDERLHPRSSRQIVRVPVRVRHAGSTFVVTARDLSATGLGVLSPVPLALGAEAEISMFVPGNTWRGTATVARCEPRPSRAGFDTWLLGLRFEREQPASEIDLFRQWDAA